MAVKKNIIYDLLKPRHFEAAVNLTLNVYLRHERACQLLNVGQFPEHDKHAEKYFYGLAEQGCSFAAVDGDSSDVVGVLFNSEVVKDKLPSAATNQSASKSGENNADWTKLLALYQQNKAVIPNIFKHFGVDKYFYLGYLSVRPDYGSKGIGVTLMKNCEDWLIENGYKLAVADVTANQTKHITINKMGFKVLGEMKYKDFVWNGEKILAHVDELENLKLVAKTY